LVAENLLAKQLREG